MKTIKLVEILRHLAQYSSPKLLNIALHIVESHDDDEVILAAIEVLETQANKKARLPLLKLASDPDTTQRITSIREIINKNIEKKIWYGNSWIAKSKPDLKMLKELSSRINNGLVLIFKIKADAGSWVTEFRYTGYLVDIDNNISYKEFYLEEQSSVATDFGIVEEMTKKLFKSYLRSNS